MRTSAIEDADTSGQRGEDGETFRYYLRTFFTDNLVRRCSFPSRVLLLLLSRSGQSINNVKKPKSSINNVSQQKTMHCNFCKSFLLQASVSRLIPLTHLTFSKLFEETEEIAAILITWSSRDNYLSESTFWKISRKKRLKFWQNWTEKIRNSVQ